MNPSIPRCFFLIFASMKIMEVPYNQINKFSKLVVDYVNEDKNIKPFINHFPNLENLIIWDFHYFHAGKNKEKASRYRRVHYNYRRFVE